MKGREESEEEGNEDKGLGSCSPHHDSSRGEEKRDEVGFWRPGSDSGKQLARLPAGKDFPSFLDEHEPEATERSSNAAEAQREGDEGGRKSRGKVGGPTCQ